jgi:DNA-binding winged helix-turn-helix (wHTH) protein/TolB-like protein
MGECFEFSEFRVDGVRRRLTRGGEILPVTSRAFDTLAVLLARRGEDVSKAELMDSVWGDTAVEENNLTQQIAALRRAFGERSRDHRFIVTVPGKGYCFVAAVRRVGDVEIPEAAIEKYEPRNGSVPTDVPALDSAAAGRLKAGLRTGGGLGYALAVVYVMLVALPAFFVSSTRPAEGPRTRSIAILEFRSAGVGDELLGMGIRDTLRAKLGSIEDVAVRPAAPIPAPDVVEAGRRMNVDVVLTGSIQHDADRVRVAVEMVDVRGERIVWGNTFDASSGAFELQDSIAAEVAEALRRARERSAVPNFGETVSPVFARVVVFGLGPRGEISRRINITSAA